MIRLLTFLLIATTPVLSQAALPAAGPGAVPTLAPMLKQVLPAVVNVSVTAKREIQNPLLQDPFFRRFFDLPDQPRQRESQSVGSGVIVDAGEGLVLTNHHVISQADTIRVRLSDDRVFDAELVGSDADSDLAVLRIDADDLQDLTIANSDSVQVGDFVIAIGNPFGVGQTVTSGIVSGLGRSGLGNRYENFIQTDASINPGNSGGALVNLQGGLVGINSQIISRTGTSAGIGFAIPSNQVKFVLREIIAHGEVKRGRIGVQGQSVSPDLARAFGLDAARGAVISQVIPDSPADKAGLKPEDIVLEADGQDLRDFDQLRNIVGLKRVGERVDLKVLRDGRPRLITVKIGEETEQAQVGGELHQRLAGAVFAPADESNSEDEGGGVVVQRVQAGSPAAQLGFRPGDVIIGVNRKRIRGMDDFRSRAGADQEQLLLHIRRGNNAFFVVVR